MSEINMNNQYAPAQPQFNAPAAAEKKPLPTKLIAIAAAAVAAIILLIALLGNGVPGKVEKELEDKIQDTYGYKIKGLDVEKKVSSDGVTFYVITGQFKGEVEDDEEFEGYEDYKGGYFMASAYKYKDDVCVSLGGIFEKDDKDDLKDEIKDMMEDYDSDAKKETKEFLSEIAEFIKEDDMDLDEAISAAIFSQIDF